ncbi:MAG: DUF1638 domain-containing protein [Acidobacteria bacterium]|nr:DUF1638 domain-containing protein [Acidobacteriota bacterium]
MSVPASTLIIACGALGREINALQKLNGWDHITLQCLPAELHNTPKEIPQAVRSKIEAGRDQYERIFVAYADCGTGGLLDRVLEEYGIERLPGAHCYEFFAGSEDFAKLCESDLGTFYLTDFLVRHFERLVYEGLGLDRHPELLPVYFRNYRKLVYLAQVETDELQKKAQEYAERLGLDYQYQYTGLELFARELRPAGLEVK